MNREEFEYKNIDDQIAWVIEHSRADDHTYLKWFCDIYAEKKSDGTYNTTTTVNNKEKTEDSSDNVIKDHPVFISFVVNELPRVCPLEFVMLLRIFARVDGLEKRINDLRGLHPLYEVLRNHVIGPMEIIENGILSLGLLATNGDVRRSCKEEGIITLLTDLLKVYKSDSGLVKLICNALNNVCYKDSESKIIFIESGGFLLLIYIIGSNVNQSAKKSAVLLLRSVCNLDQDRNYLVDTVDTAIEDVLMIMQQELTNNCPAIQIHLLWTVLNLTRNNRDFKRQVGGKDGCNYILQVLDLYRQHRTLPTLACLTLLQLAKIKYNRMAIGKAKGLSIIMYSFQTPKYTYRYLKITLKLINRLCLQGMKFIEVLNL